VKVARLASPALAKT
jgi:hypothetical protein